MNNTRRVRRVRQEAAVTTTVRTIGIGTAKRADTSRQTHHDEDITGLLSGVGVLHPPYNPDFLSMCVERSNMLKQCISAVVTNVALSGFDMTYVRVGEKQDDAEREELLSFIESANSEESLMLVHAKAVQDYETYGYCFIEVIRDRKQRISALRHAAAYNMRLTNKDPEPQRVDYEVNRGRRKVMLTEFRTMRRYVQVVGGRLRYFKEFGDERSLDYLTGQWGAKRGDEATEIIHIRQHSNDPYGIPRWINQLPSILGSREAEECNLRYFEDNTIPPMIMSVAGGRLTSQSYRDLTQVLHRQDLGRDRQNKIILVEAVAEQAGLDDKGSVSLKIDKLTDTRPSDGLFKEYDEGNQAKIRSSFRLPPVAVGMSQDVNFATANVSAFLAESQVYLPLRNIFDEIYNKRIINGPLGLGLHTCRLASRVPLIANSESIVKTLTALNVMGAITPRMANEAANRTLQIDLPEYPAKDAEGWEEWMDKPIVFVTKGTASDAGQAVKDETTKDVEEDGDVSKQAPEHGQE